MGAARRGLAPALAMLIFSACGTSVSETYVNDPPATMTPRGRHSVRIYASGAPERPHMDVAILQVEQTHGLNEQGLDIMLDRLRTRAAQLGCDGVVVGGIRERDGFPAGTAFYLLDPGATTLHGTCIVFTNKPLPAKPPQPPPALPASAAASSRPSTGECPCRAP
ncbi:MAG TPA: hypothetical protein VF524_03305 [Polyangia bacterium]